MKILKLTAAQYLKAISLGYYEELKYIKLYKRIVTHFKLCGRTEQILIQIIPTKFFNNFSNTTK
jgi:hypothetical protein